MATGQYWSWFLSGTASSEATSLGCHSDLWNPRAADYSSLARRRGWSDRFAPLAAAGDVAGTLRPSITAATGLPGTCRVQADQCEGGECVVGAINAQRAILADRGQPLAARRDALKFVVHFVGDVHQPLHAGYAHDKGGNDVQVNFDGQGTNLHTLWDSRMLVSTGRSEHAYLAHLRTLPRPAIAAMTLPPPAAAWAEQSCRVVTQPDFYPRRAKLADHQWGMVKTDRGHHGHIHGCQQAPMIRIVKTAGKGDNPFCVHIPKLLHISLRATAM